jgi:hypothetical protein
MMIRTSSRNPWIWYSTVKQILFNSTKERLRGGGGTGMWICTWTGRKRTIKIKNNKTMKRMDKQTKKEREKKRDWEMGGKDQST